MAYVHDDDDDIAAYIRMMCGTGICMMIVSYLI